MTVPTKRRGSLSQYHSRRAGREGMEPPNQRGSARAHQAGLVKSVKAARSVTRPHTRPARHELPSAGPSQRDASRPSVICTSTNSSSASDSTRCSSAPYASVTYSTLSRSAYVASWFTTRNRARIPSRADTSRLSQNAAAVVFVPGSHGAASVMFTTTTSSAVTVMFESMALRLLTASAIEALRLVRCCSLNAAAVPAKAICASSIARGSLHV